MRECCQNCHFLAKATVAASGPIHRWSWNEQERIDLHLKRGEAAQCAQGVWDTGVDPHLNSRLSEILLKQRGVPKPKPLPEAVFINPPIPSLTTQDIAL